MSFSTTLIQCQVLQEQLNSGWDYNTLISEKTPLLDVLMAPENRNGVSQRVSPGQGKLLDYMVTYFQRLPTSVVQEGEGWTCTSANQTGNLSTTYEMDSADYLAYSEVITESEMERVCTDNGEYFSMKVNQVLDVVRRATWAQAAGQSVALIGNYSSDTPNVTSDFLQVNTLVGSTNDRPAPFTLEEIENAAMLTNYPKQGVILADMAIWQYMRRVNAGCCQDTGINLSEMLGSYGMPTMYDREIQNAFGGQAEKKSLMFSLGALQLLTHTTTPWTDGIRPDVRSGANYWTTVIFDASGVPYDLRVTDLCGDGISIMIKSTTRVVGLPINMFPTGDVFDGVTFVNGIKTVNA